MGLPGRAATSPNAESRSCTPRHAGRRLRRRLGLGLGLGLALAAAPSGCGEEGADPASPEAGLPLAGLGLAQVSDYDRLGLPPLASLWRPVHSSLLPSAHIVRQETVVRFTGLPAGSVDYNWGLVEDDVPGHYLAAVRVETLSPRGERLANRIGLTTLDAHLRPLAPLTFVDAPPSGGSQHTAEDPRLVRHGGQVYVVYNRAVQATWTGPRAMRLARVVAHGPPRRRRFALADDRMLSYWHLDEAVPPLVQKNWAPFSHGQNLCFLYRTSPTVTVCLSDDQLASSDPVLTPKLWAHSSRQLAWDWGEVRGGTPAFYLPEIDRMGTFFHSSKQTRQLGSKWHRRHYFTGFMTFLPRPPFTIDQVVDHPIITPLWMSDMDEARWHIMFVQGVVVADDHLWISYGRNDRYAALAQLDRAQLVRYLSAARVRPSAPLPPTPPLPLSY